MFVVVVVVRRCSRETKKDKKKETPVFFPLLPRFFSRFVKNLCRMKMDVFLDVFSQNLHSLLIKKSTKSIYPLTTTTRTRNARAQTKRRVRCVRSSASWGVDVRAASATYNARFELEQRIEDYRRRFHCVEKRYFDDDDDDDDDHNHHYHGGNVHGKEFERDV